MPPASQDDFSPAPKQLGALRILKGILTAITGPWTWRNARWWLKMAVLVLAIRWAWFEPFRIPSPSMEPTLHGEPSWFKGDRVAVNKFLYGWRFPLNQLRIPFTDIVLDYADGRIWRGRDPERWDIVVFKSPAPDDRGEILIKRLVGLPGERIHIADGKVWVNGKALEPPAELAGILDYTDVPSEGEWMQMLLVRAESGLDAEQTYYEPDEEELARYVLAHARQGTQPRMLNSAHEGAQTLLRDLARLRGILQERGTDPLTPAEEKTLVESMHPLSVEAARHALAIEHEWLSNYQYGVRPEDEFAVVPEDCYLMLGDNSNHSKDGRSFGWVPNEHVMGRAFCIWWPISRWRDFTGFSGTWWGRLLLYGIPGLAAAIELCALFFLRSASIRRADRTGEIRGEDHILVNLAAFGVRVPFAGGSSICRCSPCAGEMIAYLKAGERREAVGMGRIVQATAGAETGVTDPDDGPCFLVAPKDADGADQTARVPCRDVLGRVLMVWWPLHRVRVIRSGSQAPETES